MPGGEGYRCGSTFSLALAGSAGERLPLQQPALEGIGRDSRRTDFAQINSGARCYESVKATRGLLVTDLAILNHGEVTRTTLEKPFTPFSPDFHTTPTGGHLSLDRFNVHCPPPYMGGSRLELIIRRSRVRYLDHQATAAIQESRRTHRGGADAGKICRGSNSSRWCDVEFGRVPPPTLLNARVPFGKNDPIRVSVGSSPAMLFLTLSHPIPGRQTIPPYSLARVGSLRSCTGKQEFD
ncbi:hypothetical protein TNCV_3302981 [Trichonephila clavipes]|nr:hypothetical protein TNCV_3302981 [Trichonephila clavipes]